MALDRNTNPDTAISDLERDLGAAEQAEQLSVLAEQDYLGAQKFLKEAQENSKDKDERDEVLKNVGISRTYLSQAQAKAKTVVGPLSEIVTSRKLALDAGAVKHNRNELQEIDDDLSDLSEKGAGKISKTSLDDKSSLQKRYLDLELSSMKSQYLGDARAHIEGSKKLGAKKISPKTLKMAEEKYKSAEVAIETDRHNPSVVQEASKSALDAATKLAVITQTAVNSKDRSPEQIAIEIEKTRASNVALASEVKDSAAALATSASTNQSLDRQNQRLAQSSDTLSGELSGVKVQEAAIAKAEQSFGKDEAEVYRQGDKLLIRLKALNFKSGSANLPNGSIDLLGKVREVVTEFNPSAITIEGHTDSTGNPAANMKLSEERANAVAKYMISTKVIAEDGVKTQGFGPEKPLKPNGTASGRASNRRVDLILVPSDPNAI
jgi:outer membrane protein OmpA-like peptidoglycan-associated protein